MTNKEDGDGRGADLLLSHLVFGRFLHSPVGLETGH